jgi:hypothetical protein
LEQTLPRAPLTSHLLDHLAVNRLCELTSVTRCFGLQPARLEQSLGYLEERRWWPELSRLVWGA